MYGCKASGPELSGGISDRDIVGEEKNVMPENYHIHL
jgi:hypothetical protein